MTEELPKPLPPGTPGTSAPPREGEPVGDARGLDGTLQGGAEDLPRPLAPGGAAAPQDVFDTVVSEPSAGLLRASSPPRPRPAPPAPRRYARPRRAHASPPSAAGAFPLRPSAPRQSAPNTAVAATGSYRGQRRRGPDLIGLVPPTAAILAWFSLGVAGVFYDRAHPKSYGLDGFFGVKRGMSVSGGDLDVSYGMIWVTLLVCLVGLAFNSRRMRRAGDRYNRSLLLLGVGTAIALVVDAFMSS